MKWNITANTRKFNTGRISAACFLTPGSGKKKSAAWCMRKCWPSFPFIHSLIHTHTPPVLVAVRLLWRMVVANTALLCALCVRGRFRTQQQPPLDAFTGWLWNLTLDFSSPHVPMHSPIFFLISAAMVMKACSTLLAFFALASRNRIPRESANSWNAERNDLNTVLYC